MDLKNIVNIYECSPLQKGMLFHTVHQPESDLYIEQIRLTFTAALDKQLFQEAWESTIERHDALRTTFHWKGTDIPLQVVLKKISVPWVEESWKLQKAEAKEQLDLTAGNIRKQPIDIEKGPLMKFTLIEMSDGLEFIWTFHHLLMDGWSMPIVLRDVLYNYQSLVDKKPVSGKTPPQYGEYISWLKNQDLKEALNFFKQKYEGFTEPSYLTTKAVSNIHIIQNHYKDFFIDEQERKQLESIARTHNVTLFSVLQSIWALLINSRTNQSDVVMGTVMSGRRPEVPNSNEIVGPFINTLPLRIKLKRNSSLLDIIQQVQKEQTELLQYEYTPLFEVQKASGLNADKPLFDNIIVFENYPFDPKLFQDGNLSITAFQVEEKSNFPVSLAIIPLEGKLLLRLHFSTDAIGEEEADEILSSVALLTKQMIDNINRPIDSLQLRADTDIEISKWDLSDSFESYELIQAMTLHEQFEEQAIKYGDRIAVNSELDNYTYKELSYHSNRLAAYIQSKGFSVGQHIAVMMEKSSDLIIAVLGILKAGGVYVPVDEQMPKERINYILRDSDAAFIITGRRNTIPFYDGVPCISVSSHAEGTEGIENPKVRDNQAAYLMYTSGSTGEPKGVTVTHKAASLHYQAFKSTFEINEADKVLQFGTITFDPSLEQIFPTLFSGGEVFIRGEHLWDAQELVDKVNEYGITIGNLPTPYWNEVVQYFELTAKTIFMPSMRMLAVGGDKLSKIHVEKWNIVHRGKTELYNFYGPTEIVTTCTFYKVTEDLADTATISIGKPFTTRRAYILDSMDREVPIGKPGELYIGGPILANGYHLKPAQTAERFIPDPFSPIPGSRMYRTGDIVASSLSGDILFHGRNDDQLKIRGYRVELEEIERALLSIAGVSQAVVKAENILERKTLIAYISSENSMKQQQVKSILSKSLPEYMIPKSIVILDKLPILTNGKVDLQALPLPKQPEDKSTATSTIPKNTLQEKMVLIWKRVLGIDYLGIQDNFFELGGDSILALQITSQSQEDNIHLTTKDIFEHQTIEEISYNLLEKERNEDLDLFLSNIDESDNQPFTPVMNWFFEKNLSNPHHWNQSILISSKEDLSVIEFKQALEHVVRTHPVFQARYIFNSENWMQFSDDGPSYNFEVIDLQGNDKSDIKGTKIIEAQSTLDISKGPLMRILYFRNKGENKFEVFLTIHHLIMDGVSWRIILEDLQTAYLQILNNEQVKLQTENFSFKDWGHFLKRFAKSEKLLGEYPYWKKAAEASMCIPRDFETVSDEQNTEQTKSKKTFIFTEQETEYLLTGVNNHLGAKIQETLITSLIVTLRNWTGNENVKIDLEGHGREELIKGIHLNRTVGWFTSLYPFYFQTDKSKSLLQLLTDTLIQIRDIPNNGIGYGLLKYFSGRTLQEETAEVSFNYLGQFMNSHGNGIFEITANNVDTIRDPESKRAYLIDIEGAVIEGKLYLDWLYSNRIHTDQTIDLLISDFVSNVKRIISLAKQFENSLVKPKAFPKVNLSEEEWDLVTDYSTDLEDIYPLSPVQEGMLFHTLLHPGSGVYVEQMAFRIYGDLSAEGFSKAWNHVLESNSILRADFLWEGFQRPIHVINPISKVKVEFMDWTGRAAVNIEEELRLLRDKERLEGFSPGKDPMIKLKLILLDNNLHYFIWTYHHLLLDGWSMPMVINQLSDSYNAFNTGKELNKISTLSFGDFSYWQSKQDFSSGREFWLEKLNDYENRAMLNGSRTSEENMNKEMKFQVSNIISKNLKALAANKKTTLNSVIQSGWALLLGTLGRKDQVIFGSVLSGRSAPIEGIEGMVGMFINTLPVGIRIEREKSVSDFLIEMHNTQRTINQFEHTPFINVKEAIGYKQKEPLFDTCLIFANFPNVLSSEGEAQLLEGVSIQNVEITEQTNFPLTLSIVPGERISLDINYSCSQYNEEDINLYLKLLEKILVDIAANPDCKLDKLMASFSRFADDLTETASHQKKETNRSNLNNRRRKPVTL
ncbi:non-ribosomal peptide synthetase [Bacillus infantis]|uniref:Amino acid adenylation domain-containing protein n=1 Tax=Bacillus infantis TaxID=324767 RepID=A0A5D4RN04_9BACI|nr:non-ribosomal peptide synthetase [Bacillus infantis]TYS51128.1 amino acid adenylation domain-containing protein [Bacillus infantis]